MSLGSLSPSGANLEALLEGTNAVSHQEGTWEGGHVEGLGVSRDWSSRALHKS